MASEQTFEDSYMEKREIDATAKECESLADLDTGFDPATGNILYRSRAEFDRAADKPIRSSLDVFDPATGHLIRSSVDEFDPATGKLVSSLGTSFNPNAGTAVHTYFSPGDPLCLPDHR